MDERRQRFEQLAPALIGDVRRFLARRTDPATAEDVLAETLLVCWRRLDDLPDPPTPWAYGVARNCLANAERSHRRRGRLFARLAVVDPPRPIPAPEPADVDLIAVLDRLRPVDAEVLRLWAWEDLGPSEIAEVLQISVNAANLRLHRARARLRDELGKPDQASGHIETTGGSRQ
ncbi:RNA polymerase sigma-70 factor (ECF subfamily) [Propionicimonas paludicola]|uniref:RNA polymerase sigma-70 factor (ECF subfamily) n=1 Tax=Propionicimonas paludicola TaxID=185243 RepID=A0A2A9CRV7_9ACTN|nr:sigma-70 family RNA polymerase sigma factor [Propionicimonas paludicola]PFG16825.1 RNA polymerase sigma-70 factor (ECF subfamily) [Propionicimonas paludicola]